MHRLLLLAALTLGACGADGMPEAPSKGLSMTGEAQVGAVLK